MKISKYLAFFLKDFLVACGCMMIITALFLTIYPTETTNTSLLWQIIILASAFTFFKYALVNTHENALGKKAQMVSFFICFVLADIMILLWLYLISPNKMVDKTVLAIFFIVIVIVKGLVSVMMYIDGRKQAKQLNEKLSEYNRES